jgi:hypothetical protein
MFKEAKETASRIEESYDRAWTLREIAKAEAQAGMIKEAAATFKEAKETASRIERSDARASALREIAKAEAQAALKAAQKNS